MKSKINTLLSLQFFFILFLTGMMETIIVGIMPSISLEFGISNTVTGQLISIYALTFALSGPVLIYFTKNFNLKKTLIFFLLLFMLSNIGIFFSTALLSLFFFRIVNALSASALVAKTLESCFLIFKGNKKMIAFINMGFSSSIALGVPLGAYVSGLIKWQYIFGFSAILTLAISLILYIIYPDISIYPEKNMGNIRGNIFTRANIKLLLITMLILSSNMAFVGYMSPFLIERYSFGVTTISWVLAILGMGGVFGSYLSGYIMSKYNIKKSLIILLLLFTAILLFLNLKLPVILLIPLIFLWGLVQWATGPIIQVAIATCAKEEVREQLISLNMSALNIGSAVGGLVGGVFILEFPLGNLPLLSASIATVALFFSFRIK